MFEIGDFIIYGTNGICEVIDITTMDLPGIPGDKMYYVLQPGGQGDNRIFTAVDNRKMIMRKIMTWEEANHLIEEIPQIEELWISDEKQREELYKVSLRSCQGREWVKIIKTLYVRREERIAQGKKITATDERYLKLAEESLFGELAIPLQITRESMSELIAARILI
jgi:CarD family transcriptional regulator